MRSVWWLVRSKISNRCHEEAGRDEQSSRWRYLSPLSVSGWGSRGLDMEGKLCTYTILILSCYSMLEDRQAS